ncbi:DUF6183 family protein [Streptomyces sp. MMG1533]|uniref:DUF6183 family protein n=1 Tax=Streptomyces sp. MMG1533 TaxID=1415546 RepID=UPI0006AF104A|nr:DUF6183 family protein [Streptomyces sp. MMG1533]
MSELPDDASLKVYAATDPERLHDLALTASSSHDIAKLSRLLADQRSQAATDWAVRLAERLGRERTDTWRALARRIAWQLAQRPSIVALRPQFENHTPVALDDPATEFRACLLHEMALRFGFGRRHDDVYLDYGAGLRALGHPLAWLPLGSLHFEHSMRAGAYMEGLMVGSATPESLRIAYPEIPPTEGGARAGRAARRVPDESRAESAATGFSQLAQYEAAFYALPEPLDAGDFNSALLAELDADCLDAVTTDTLATVHTTADDLAADLFIAAFGGGLWNEGHHGAYARLFTWRSLYALMDLDTEVSHHDAVRLAADHRWLRFALAPYTDNRWFAGDLTDTAFACLDPTRTRVAVIAASETD